MHAFFVHKLVS